MVDRHHLYPDEIRLYVLVHGRGPYSRRIIGWATGRKIDAELALRAFLQAVALRSSLQGLIVPAIGVRNLRHRRSAKAYAGAAAYKA